MLASGVLRDERAERPLRGKPPTPLLDGLDRRVLKGDLKPDLRDTSSLKEKYCPFHDRKGHDLARCFAFAKKPFEEKTQWITEAKLCFRCLTDQHIAMECKADIQCSKCGSRCHLALLHMEKRTEPIDPGGELTSSCTSVCNGRKGGMSCSKVVLVDVFLQGHEEKTLNLCDHRRPK